MIAIKSESLPKNGSITAVDHISPLISLIILGFVTMRLGVTLFDSPERVVKLAAASVVVTNMRF